VNRDEAKKLLLLHRPGLGDGGDSQVAQALALAKQDAELALWLEKHLVEQEALRAKFRQIAPPAGLREQIIAEETARKRWASQQRTVVLMIVSALVLLAGLATLWFQRPPPENDFANYRSRMVRVALTGYAMDIETNDIAAIRSYLARQNAPADYVLPAGLMKADVTGCAIEKWHGKKVSMVCFRTGHPATSGASSDLWLFVVEQDAFEIAPPTGVPEITKVNRLMTATWRDGTKVYLIGAAASEETIRSLL
jgi:hypothetical protein